MTPKRKIPTFKSDRAAAFVRRADLTQYDLTGAQLTRFKIKPKVATKKKQEKQRTNQPRRKYTLPPGYERDLRAVDPAQRVIRPETMEAYERSVRRNHKLLDLLAEGEANDT